MLECRRLLAPAISWGISDARHGSGAKADFGDGGTHGSYG